MFMGRLVGRRGRRHCGRDMRERVRRECVGTSRLRGQGDRVDMTDLVEPRVRRLRITAAEAVLRRITVAEVVLNRPARRLR